MFVTVEVYAERIATGERKHTHTAHVVFVAIDENGKPKKVPRLVPETDAEKRRFEAARVLMERARARE
jgi:acyl-CoA hydrolase